MMAKQGSAGPNGEAATPKTAAQRAVLIGLDWGSTSLRAYLFGPDGTILQQRSEAAGVLNVVERKFAAARDRTIGDWLTHGEALPVIACGMIGSTVGWREVPYVSCPAGFTELATALAAQRRIAAADGLTIVPGLNVAFGGSTAPGRTPDVMRGEETQVLGALERRPDLANGCRMVMPGTHSKWVHVRHGAIQSFRTYMTGEVFAVMRDHSILGRPAQAALAAAGAAPIGTRPAGPDFERGVDDAKTARATGLAGLLFAVRTRVLAGEVAAHDSLDYLSGILIGDEVRSGLADMQDAAQPLALIGDATICGLYRRAFSLFQYPEVAIIDDTAVAGLWRLAIAAGLVQINAAQNR